MFGKSDAEYTELYGDVDFSGALLPTRFENIRKYFYAAFSTCDPVDPWGPFRGFVLQFNAHMASMLEFGRYFCLGEL